MADKKALAAAKPAVKPAAATKAVAEVAKKAETKVAEKKVEEKKEVAKPAAKKEAAKPAAKKAAAKPAAKKETAKPAAKKAAAKPAAKKAETAVINIQFAGKDYKTEDFVNIAKDVWKYDLGKKTADFKTVELYVKPEESKVYYVINDEVSGSFDI